MNELESKFDFNLADLHRNQQQQLSTAQIARLKSVFTQDMRQKGSQILGYFGIIAIFSLIVIVFYGRSWQILLAIIGMWIIWVGILWSYVFSKHGFIYLLRRLQTISRQPALHTLNNIRREDFDIRDHLSAPQSELQAGNIYISHAYYGNWIKAYTWFKISELATYDRWYRLNSDLYEIYLAAPQYKVLNADKLYSLHCFVDSHNVAYVLSVEKLL